MRTLLTQFCEDFERVFHPITEPIHEATEALAASVEPIPAKELEPEVIELRHDVEQLTAKVSEQQAYVLIFGPLKSGKSTLMNALCASYVSEVSSLPAYPCMVFVSHADNREFTVTLYNGQQQVFRDENALHVFIHRAHGELAEETRRAEQVGRQFDPVVDFPGAVRRIDVRLPAGDLAQSGAVLVDTPGLYSRMKFGYDRMTREFRNAAACAVFVVRSDNLFLEQVFEEFTELLELFSRIFLVVNLDVHKQDLGMRGELVPSLEQQDPGRIIDAFERLAMSAPLKAAADAGRLRIYPVGLLPAASERLQSALGDPSPEAPADESPATDMAGFGPFLHDLNDYLASPDYLVAFLGDSLRRASVLLQESRAIASHQHVRSLAQEVEDLDRQCAAESGRLEAVDRLASLDWPRRFQEARAEVSRDVESRIEKIDDKSEGAIHGVIERWFRTSASLDALTRDELQTLFTGYQEEVARVIEQTLQQRIRTGHGGLKLRDEVTDDLGRVGLTLESVAREALEESDRGSLVVVPPRPVQTEQIPLRRSLWDWLLLRSRAKLRKRIFGLPERPSAAIPPEVKATRLGSDGRRAMIDCVGRFHRKFSTSTFERLAEHFFGGTERRMQERVSYELEGLRDASRERLAELGPRLDSRRRVLVAFEALRGRAQDALRSIDDLSARYRGTDPADLLQPIQDDAAVELPVPPDSGEPEPKIGSDERGQRVTKP